MEGQIQAMAPRSEGMLAMATRVLLLLRSMGYPQRLVVSLLLQLEDRDLPGVRWKQGLRLVANNDRSQAETETAGWKGLTPESGPAPGLRRGSPRHRGRESL